MPFTRAYKCRQKHYTPPPVLFRNNGHVTTPRRACIMFAKTLSQKLNIRITSNDLYEITNVKPRVQSDILSFREVRTLHNQVNKGPEPRGRKRALTRSDTTAMAMYLKDDNVSLKDRGAPWLNIATKAGVNLPETWHFKPPGYRMVNTQTVQIACIKDEDLINGVCHEEKLLNPSQAQNRYSFADKNLEKRPHSDDWKNVFFCDKFHFSVGPQITKRVKRKRGRAHRDHWRNVHRKKVTSKDTKAKAREEEPLKLINVFVIVGRNYKCAIPYEVPNKVGKMNAEVYINILDQLRGDLTGITLWQNKDSAHDSKPITAWAKKHSIKLLTSPGSSPDLSIMESMAHPIKKQFHTKCCASETAAMARFEKVFGHETDQNKINEMYEWYTKRLHECMRLGGQMTKY